MIISISGAFCKFRCGYYIQIAVGMAIHSAVITDNNRRLSTKDKMRKSLHLARDPAPVTLPPFGPACYRSRYLAIVNINWAYNYYPAKQILEACPVQPGQAQYSSGNRRVS